MRGRSALAALAALAVVAAGAVAHGRPSPAALSVLRADPSKIVAAELAFARLAQSKGQWTAFSETATEDAVMFVPEAVNARRWLKGRANPAAAVTWQPAEVWVSCDGSLAVSKGPWQRAGTVGYFTTVWQRQRDGGYRWVLDQGDTLAQPLPAPDMIAGKVAECAIEAGPPRPNRPDLPLATLTAPACQGTQCSGGGASADGTLTYSYTVAPSGARNLVVMLRQEGALRQVLTSQVAAN